MMLSILIRFIRVDFWPAHRVDYAVMERPADAVVVLIDAGWSDGAPVPPLMGDQRLRTLRQRLPEM